MSRVKDPEVKDLTGSKMDREVIRIFIDTAHSVVNELLGNKGMSDEQLKRIELFLAAHFLTANRERQEIEEEVDPARVRYSDIFSEGLKSTTYGQTAIQIDPTNTLVGIDKKSVKIHAIEEDHEFKYDH